MKKILLSVVALLGIATTTFAATGTLIKDGFDATCVTNLQNADGTNSSVTIALTELDEATAINVVTTFDPDKYYGNYMAILAKDDWASGQVGSNYTYDESETKKTVTIDLTDIKTACVTNSSDVFYIVCWDNVTDIKVYSDDYDPDSYWANLIYAVDGDNSFYTDNWGYLEGSSIKVNGYGTYTITATGLTGANHVSVLTVDIEGMWDAGYTDETTAGTVDKVEINGVELDGFDASKVHVYAQYADYRLDIYNEWSGEEFSTAAEYGDDSPFSGLDSFDSISVTFTLSEIKNNAIQEVKTSVDAVEVGRYNVAGQKISGETKGINIIKYSDGSSKKVLVK